MSYVILDTETTMLQVNAKGKHYSDPLLGDTILTIGLKYKDRLESYTQDYMPKGWLEGIDLIIGHNLSFDLKFIWRNDELQAFFRRGGRIWDTQLVEYILSGQRHKYPALRDIAVNKYSRPERVKHIEGRLTQETPIELLLEDVRNDVLDTEAIALAQARIAKEEGMTGLIQSQMDGRLCTIEEEYNGFKVNQDLMQKNSDEIEEKLIPLHEEIEELGRKYFPEGFPMNLNSTQQLAALFFGGKVGTEKVKIQEGHYKNGNPKYRTETRDVIIEGLGLKPHKDWLTGTGRISVNEKVLKGIIK